MRNKLKIALIVFPIHASHGCILQTFAMQEVLTRAGHDVYIIDKQRDDPGFISICKEHVKIMIKKFLGRPAYSRKKCNVTIMQELNQFVDSRINKRIVCFQNPDYKNMGGFDAFIVGSDQTWRPKYVADVKYYFLSFVPSEETVLRIAYAPSFGTDEWEYSPELTRECAELLKRFDAISVREESAIKLCYEYFGVKPIHVLDPTMLLTKEDYMDVVGKKYKKENKLSYYLLDYSDEKKQIVNIICKKLHLAPVRINTETENHRAKLAERVAPSFEKWIGGFAESSFIVADSFHATVFAILFNKPFIAIANPQRGLARFESLLNLFGLMDRMIFNSTQLNDNILYSQVDWNYVNNKLNIERDISIKFLTTSLLSVETKHKM